MDLAAYELKSVPQVWYDQWKGERSVGAELESKLKRKNREVKRARTSDGNFSNAISNRYGQPRTQQNLSNQVSPNTHGYNQEMASNPKPQRGSSSESSLLKPTCTKCGKKHYGRCLAGKNGCGNDGHKMRDCPILRAKGREAKQASLSGPDSNTPKKNHFYALWSRDEKRALRMKTPIATIVAFHDMLTKGEGIWIEEQSKDINMQKGTKQAEEMKKVCQALKEETKLAMKGSIRRIAEQFCEVKLDHPKLKSFYKEYATMLGQKTLQVSSTSISYFGSSSQRKQGSFRKYSQGRNSVAQKIKKTLDPLKLSNSKKSSTNKNYNSAIESSTHAYHDFYPLKIDLQDNLCYSPMSQMIKQAIVTDDSFIEEQLANLAKIVE
ncbi:hypothetical protein MTR67_002842 [Solanum verrucosum]|uniref:CCHC-type domain-containing protein n=1 Tax=Solanum verrucosum TaxID=315347 RepID=A0AAF0T6B6_SOLVR|nr:hypothetical protein MTR67_002842 [Solanum verrucosum]